jgi:hypothetical protein
MNFKRRLNHYNKAKYSLDSYVWDVFYKYINLEDINFSGPDYWEDHDDYIRFTGEDGCMGCYDPMSLSIPLKFFENPDTAFKELKEEKESKKINEEKAKKIRKEQEDRRLYDQLKMKFGD